MRPQENARGSRTVIGVDIGGTKTKAGIVDESGAQLAEVEIPTDPTAGTKSILTVIEDLSRRGEQMDIDIEAVGIGAAGFVSSATGSVTFAPNLVYDDPHIAHAVHARTGLPVVVDNDANAAVWGERTFGTARGADDIVLLTLGTGVGSGIISNGRLIRGATGAGAEFGHTIVDPEGPQCNCGLRGCVEQFASGQAIARMGREAVGADPDSTILAFADSIESITAQDVAKAARQLDESARDVMRRAGLMLGIAMSNLANLFDPEVIVLGGSVVRAGEPFLGPARDQLAEMTAAQRRRPMRLDVSSLGGEAAILGAAALAFDEARIPPATERP
jgi:glucokinase